MDLNDKKILIIEDEEDIAEILADYLHDLGFATKTCLCVAEAEAEAELLLGYYAILSDIHMPGKSGLDFLHSLRLGGNTVPPWIFISGNGDTEVIERASNLGAIDVVQKPFNGNDLAQALRRVGGQSSGDLSQIMDIVQRLSGVLLQSDKRLLAETRLMRRVRALRLRSIEDYLNHFNQHRAVEIDHVVSLLTTDRRQVS